MKTLIKILRLLKPSKKEKYMENEELEALPEDEAVNQPVSDEPEVVVEEEPVVEEPEGVLDISLPVFEGKQVTAILDDGRETETEYHCSMADGTTMHVPKELFL